MSHTKQMWYRVPLFLMPLLLSPFVSADEAPHSNKGNRIAHARKTSEVLLQKKHQKAGLSYPAKRYFVRVIKDEDRLELWGSSSVLASKPFVMVDSYKICARSGTLGPKRYEGDEQVPEGVYRIHVFNAKSRFHLSLGLDYPNLSDRILGAKLYPKKKRGGAIMIHGDCVTIGCIPLGDDAIDEVFLALYDAHQAGSPATTVHVFPTRLTGRPLRNLPTLIPKNHSQSNETLRLWASLQGVNDAFERTKVLPKVHIHPRTGYYELSHQ